VFVSLRFVPVSSNTWQTFDVDLRGATIHFNAKSSFKLQNRSVTETLNVESDDVDNVPVAGRTYEGSGMSATVSPSGWKNATGYQNYAISSNVYGLINETDFQGGAASIKVLSEPPLPALVHPCTRSGKIRIEPGEIKTSVLTGGFGGSLDKFYSKLCALGGGANPGVNPVRLSFGKYRFFALEKMVDCVSFNAVNVMRFGTEIQSELSATITLHKTSMTTPDNYTQISPTPLP